MKHFLQNFQYKKAFVTLFASIAFTTVVHAQQDTIGFNSAYDYSTKTLRIPGQQCPNWKLVAVPDGSTVPRAATVNSGVRWSSLLANSHWVSTYSGDTGGVASGIYSYEAKLSFDTVSVNFSNSDVCSGDTTFFYDSSHARGITSATTYRLEMDILADNYGIVYLNNDSIGDIPNGFLNPPAHITDINQSDFIKGENTLRVDVNNSGGPSGMDVAGFISFDTKSLIAQRKWTFGDGSTSTDKNPKHEYAAPGDYSVKLVIIDSTGFADSATKVVHIKALPIANAGPDVSICKGDGVQIGSSTGSSGATYLWSPSKGLNSATIKRPVASPDSTTIYIVTIFDSGCSNRDTVKVTINPLPIADAGQDVSICTGDSTQLSATGGTSYIWTPFTGLNKTNIQNPKASPPQTTTYKVYVTNDSGCTSVDSVTVIVGGSLVIDAGPDKSICAGDSIQLNATAGGTSYSWQPTVGLSDPNIPNPKASPSSTTKYYVTATKGSCSGKDSVTITVGGSLTIDAGPDKSICAGDSIQLNATAGGTVYSWQPPTGLSNPNIANPKASPSSTTTYIVSASKGNCNGKDSVTVTVNPLPQANAGTDVMMCPNDSVQLHASGGTTYSWLPTTGLSNPASPDPVAKPTATTTYHVTVFNATDCKNEDSVVVTVLSQTSYTLSSNSVNLGTANVGSTNTGSLEFTNTTSGSIHIHSVKFTGTAFSGKVITSFPRTVLSNEKITIECSGSPPDTGIFTDELCIEIDSACATSVCIPVTIEGTSVCVKTQTSAMKTKRPGDEVTIPIIVDPTTKLASSKQITLTIQYDPSMLRMIGTPTSSYDASPTVISITPGVISFVIKPTSSFTTTSVTVADLHFQVLLSPKASSEIKVTSSEFKLSPTEIIMGGNCSELFTIDSSCIHPSMLRERSTLSDNHPNPFSGNTIIQYSLGEKERVKLLIIDIFGRVVESQSFGEQEKGSYAVNFSAQNYPNGMYFYRLETDRDILQRSMMIVK